MIRPPFRRRWATALVVAALVTSLAGAGVVIALGGGLGGADPGQDEVEFVASSEDCGLSYQTSGNSYGSADGGVFVSDVNGDGWQDLLAVGGDRPVLFVNNGSGFEASGALPDREYPPLKSALFVDGDGDGLDDLLLVPRTGEPIYLSNRNGTFRTVAGAIDADLDWGSGATTADFDRDGDLDIFVIQNGNWSHALPRRGSNGEALDGYRNLAFENTKDGFRRVNVSDGGPGRWSLAASAVDLTGDGLPDIHVANDYGRDVLLVNQGNWTFERRPIPNTNRHGMASVVRDVNGDGRPDVFVTNIEFAAPSQIWAFNSGLNVRNRGNTLLVNNGNGTFSEHAGAYGLRQGGWGWAAAIEDFDNDGTLDVMHTTKYYLRATQNGSFSGVETAPSLWEANVNGTFERRNATSAGLDTGNGRGLATLDYDRDGDRDLVIADTSAPFRLYENRNSGGHWLQIHVEPRVEGTAIGSQIRVVTSRGETLTRVQSSRSNFFSQSTRVMHFGLGPATVERIEVVRPNGTELVFEEVPTDAHIRVTANGSLDVVTTREGEC